MIEKEIAITLQDIAGYRNEFTSLRYLYDFAKKEHEVWLKYAEIAKSKQNVSEQTLDAFNYFNTLINTVDGWQSTIESWDDNHLKQQLSSLNQSSIQQINSRWLWSGQACTKAFVQCFVDYNAPTATAFLNFVVRKQLATSNNNVDSFNGAMLGYEFVNQASEITKRRNGEKVSLGHLRNSFANAKDELFTEVDELKSDFFQWDSTNKESFERLYKVNKYLGKRRIKNENKQFDKNLRTWSSTIEELEKTYEEKLRLDKPAEYWKKAARKYGIQGGLWSLAIIALVVVGLVYFREFFVTWLQGQDIGMQLNTIQGVILFGSIATVYAFLMRVLSRLTFSSFHLMRDAEEREQLTYLYLSLSHETEVDATSREIILQALFSRSETGLLAQEHGPTMPGVGEVLRNLSKGRN
jgi:hypothetical protein